MFAHSRSWRDKGKRNVMVREMISGAKFTHGLFTVEERKVK